MKRFYYCLQSPLTCHLEVILLHGPAHELAQPNRAFRICMHRHVHKLLLIDIHSLLCIALFLLETLLIVAAAL